MEITAINFIYSKARIHADVKIGNLFSRLVFLYREYLPIETIVCLVVSEILEKNIVSNRFFLP